MIRFAQSAAVSLCVYVKCSERFHHHLYHHHTR